VAAREATVVTLQDHPPGDTSRLSGALWVAVRRFDDELASSVLNRAFAVLPAGDVADRVVAPVLRRLGDSWQDDPRVIAVEHFTSAVVRARFAAHSAGELADRSPRRRLRAPRGAARPRRAPGRLHPRRRRVADTAARRRHPVHVGGCCGAELEPGVLLVGACMRSAAEAFLASEVAQGRPGAGRRRRLPARDTDEATRVVVHHGPFAAVPDVARRLLAR
jgi:hypothetical protein